MTLHEVSQWLHYRKKTDELSALRVMRAGKSAGAAAIKDGVKTACGLSSATQAAMELQIIVEDFRGKRQPEHIDNA